MSGSDDLPPWVSQTGMPRSLDEIRQFFRRLRIDDAAAGDHQWLFGGFERCNRRAKFIAVGPWPPLRPDTRLEKTFRIIIGFRLHVLAESQRNRAAFRRIGQHRHGACQCGDDLFRPGDAVEIARYGPEAIIGRNSAVGKILHLLQNRIGYAIGKDIAGQQQQGQAIDMGESRSGHHIGGAGADELVTAIMRRRKLALAKAMAAWAMACSLWAR